MNIKIENILSIIIGIAMIVLIAIGTVLVVPAIALIALAKVECETWLEAVKNIYVDMPADYLLCRV